MVTSETYEEYKREYNASLGRVRGYLAGNSSTRTRAILLDCDRLLSDAKRCATAMQALAEIEGNQLGITEAQNYLIRDIAPLQKEIATQMQKINQNQSSNQQQQRDELFYQAPDIESPHNNTDMDSLIDNSDSLLRESQSILAETEEIGTRTLQQMGRQREQMENANTNLGQLQQITAQAKTILGSMAYRAWKSKMALYVMIGTLLFANGFVLYLIFQKHRHHDNNSNDNEAKNDHE